MERPPDDSYNLERATQDGTMTRMEGSIQFRDALRKGTNVKVFMGAGWEKATVVQWEKSRCTVRLNRGNKTVVCHDARNLQTL